MPLLYCGDWNSDPPVSTSDRGVTVPGMPVVLCPVVMAYNWIRSRIKGQHDIRFGLDLARFRVEEWHPELFGPKGQFTFNGSVTLPGKGSLNQYNNYAAFLLGLPQQVAKSIEPDWMSPRQWMEDLYFRDRWQASRNLTLTLGARWEY